MEFYHMNGNQVAKWYILPIQQGQTPKDNIEYRLRRVSHWALFYLGGANLDSRFKQVGRSKSYFNTWLMKMEI